VKYSAHEFAPPDIARFPPRAERPADPAEHAKEFAQTWAGKLEAHCAIRMQELGIPDDMKASRIMPGMTSGGRSTRMDAREAKNTTGVVVNSGVMNPELLRGQKGGRIWPKARLRDRIDAIIAHEYEELRHDGSHTEALKAAPKTELPISDEARRICRAMAR
jgi:hypothetical protein